MKRSKSNELPLAQQVLMQPVQLLQPNFMQASPSYCTPQIAQQIPQSCQQLDNSHINQLRTYSTEKQQPQKLQTLQQFLYNDYAGPVSNNQSAPYIPHNTLGPIVLEPYHSMPQYHLQQSQQINSTLVPTPLPSAQI